MAANITFTLNGTLQLNSGITGDSPFTKALTNIVTQPLSLTAYGQSTFSSATTIALSEPTSAASFVYIRALQSNLGNVVVSWDGGGGQNVIVNLVPGGLIFFVQTGSGTGTTAKNISLSPSSGTVTAEWMLGG